ncbi:MAG TPA: hypothetical protein VHS29_12525 [Candidatus Acidoferrales bacterium]|nr:hypothetical protein [Candidatus Acidoferrales bacterium]
MAITIFLLLDCLGLIFLIYALANFWKEWRRDKSRRPSPAQRNEHDFEIRIATFPVLYTSKYQNSVIPFPVNYRQANLSSMQQTDFVEPIEMQRRVLPEPRASQGGK